MRVAHFTAGTVGAGHLAHAIAIGRGIARAGPDCEFRVFGPPTPFPSLQPANYRVVEIDPDQVTDPFKAPDTELAMALADYAPDLLLVEMFWAPLMYLLPLPGCEHWLLARKGRDNWLTGDDWVPFDPAPYQRIIEFEPVGADVSTDRLEPIVIANPDECREPSALRELVGAPQDRRLAVVAHAGNKNEIDEIVVDEDPDTTVVRFDLHEPGTPFPLAEWLPGADAVYCAAGYNAYWEARWLGYSDRTRFTAFGRQIDNQAWRIEECAKYTMRENGADQLARWIAEG